MAVYIRMLATGKTALVSKRNDGEPASSDVYGQAIPADAGIGHGAGAGKVETLASCKPKR